MSTLFQNATYLKPDCTGWDSGDILVSGGVISAIEPPDSQLVADEIIDAGGMLLIPGLVNAHAHSYTALLKGSVDGLPLDLYMLQAIAGGSARTEREIYVCTLLSAVQMLKQGTTSVVDHFSQRPRQELPGVQAAVEAYLKSGMRANLALMYADLDYLDSLPFLPGELPDGLRGPAADPADRQTYLRTAEEAHRLYQGAEGRIGIMLGTDGPQRCSRELLLETAALEQRLRMGWQTHVLEAGTQALAARRRFGKPLLAYMAELGVLNSRTQLVHFIWAAEEELDLVRDRGAAVVHCPGSNLHLGSGICPVGALRRRGVPLALGSDGENCGHTGMLEQVRLLARLHRVTEPDHRQWLTAAEALRCAYAGGAAAMLRGDIGAIRVGAAADLVLLDGANSLWQPAGDPTCQLVYGESGGSIRLVMVAGKKLVSEGRLLCLDERELLTEAGEIAARYRRDHAALYARSEALRPYVERMYLRERRAAHTEL